MAEVLAVARADDRISGHGVGVACRDARMDRRQRHFLRRAHELIDLVRLVVDLPHGHCARAVRAVAVDDRAHVDQQELAGAHGPVGGAVMWQGAVRTGGNDGRKRRVVGAQLAHPLMGVQHDLPLRPSHHPPVEDPAIDLVRKPGGLGDGPQLVSVLAAAKALDQAAGRHQFHLLGDALLELAQALDAGLGFVVADPPPQPRQRRVEQLAFGRRTLELRIHLALRSLDVAKVGEEDAILGAHDRQAAGPAEPCQPAQVRDRVGSGVPRADQIAHQELVDPVLRQEARQALGPGHGVHSSARFRIPSASR